VRKNAATVVLLLAAAAGLELGANPAVAASSPGLPGADRAAPPVAASMSETSPAAATAGARLWVSRYNGPGNSTDEALSAAVSPYGALVYAAGTSWGGASGFDYAAAAYSAATGARLWVSRYNGPGNSSDEATMVAVSPARDTVYVTGFSSGGISGDDYATVAYSATTGAQLWASRYTSPGNSIDQASSVAVSPSGDTVYVTGSSWGASSGKDYATVAYNATTGALLWVSRYNGPGNADDLARSIAVSPSGDAVYVTGNSYGGGAAGYDYATVAYNTATGARVWAKRYNGPGNGTDVANSLAVSPAGTTVYVTGSSDGGTSGLDYGTVAYSTATGARLWVSRYNGPGNSSDEATMVAVSPAGDTVYVTGSSSGGTSGVDYATTAYNAATGARLWVRRYNGPGNGQDNARSMVVSPAGDTVYVTGSSDGGASGVDYATVAYSAAGARLWAKRYNGPGNGTDVANSVAVSPAGTTVYVTGSSDGGASGMDYATIAYNS
jgi:DNA-binding beta-propeller fold protein YncE